MAAARLQTAVLPAVLLGLHWPAQPVCCPHQYSRLTRGQRSKNMAESDVEELEGNLNNKVINNSFFSCSTRLDQYVNTTSSMQWQQCNL